MVHGVLDRLLDAASVTALAFVMMTLVEMASLVGRGRIARALGAGDARALVLSALLGAIPGCGGAFLVVSLYARGLVTAGALAAAMLATTGDEAFVMLAAAPRLAVGLGAALVAAGIAVGWLVDLVLPGAVGRCPHAEVHAIDLDHTHPEVRFWPPRLHLRPAGPRLALGALAGTLLVVSVWGGHPHAGWDGERALAAAAAAAGLVLVALAPPHHLEEHLWGHLFRRHLPPIFAVVAVTLVGVHLAGARWDPAALFAGSGPALVVAAAALGLVPVSGPHLVVFLLYLDHRLPLAALVANALVQDGHGLLPLLALEPRRAVAVKAAKLVVGIVAGLLVLAAVG